ncbi:hypothetical protein C8K18_101269 [Paraburkholderia sp. GV068]|nr:hypothetical protein C8K19_101193 [Paraburkholderia sp. GV072]PUB08761.1 hypothetical protein C8K18_101269 [Paraburkholderia sp. GV068]
MRFMPFESDALPREPTLGIDMVCRRRLRTHVFGMVKAPKAPFVGIGLFENTNI